MNVVLIGPFAFAPKGTVRARAFPIARSLARRGHRTTILMPPYDNTEDSGRTWQQEEVRLENAVLRRDDAWNRIAVPAGLARRAVALEPDVIHVFKPIGYSGLAGMCLDCFSGRPLVLDTDDWEGRGGWSDVNPYPGLWRRFFDWQERRLARRADAVTVASRTLETQVWGFGVDPARVVYLPNGPDAALRGHGDVSAEERTEIRQRLGVGDAPLVLYLGHIPHGTDLDLAIDALAQIRDQMPEVRLVLAGIGDALSDLKGHAQKLGIADRVLFPGWIEPEEAPLVVAAADVVINPYRDTLINRAKCAGKVVAAMALGKPVLTSRVGENLEYIQDGRSGLLTEPGDVTDLARGLLELLTDKDRAAELGRNARIRIWGKFDWDARIGEVERAYEIALGQKRHAR